MPLSEHEQRLLEQMERALYAEDPKFATSMENPKATLGDRRRLLVGSLGVLVGLGLLLSGVATRITAIGVVGFLAMLGGIILVIGSFRSAPTQAATAAPGNPPKPSGHHKQPKPKRGGESLTEKMEDRWRRRRETGDF